MPDGPEILVGWCNERPEGALAFLPPEPLEPADVAAAGGFGHTVLRVRASFDLTLRLSPPGIRPVRLTRVETPGGLSERAFQGMVSRVEDSAQRRRDTPAVQIALNLILLTETPASLMLTPPFLEPAFRDWPGTLVSGRFPLRSWPRTLNAVLEWQERDRDWTIRRGEPLVYLWLTAGDPDARVRLVEAARTPAFERHFRRISGVIEYGRNVGPMFAEAEARRPARLLQPKALGTPAWETPARKRPGDG